MEENKVHTINDFEEIESSNDEVKKDSIIDKVKSTASQAKDIVIDNVCKAVIWGLENPKKAIGIPLLVLGAYNEFVRPITKDIQSYKKDHTYKYYDQVNGMWLTLNRPLTKTEREMVDRYVRRSTRDLKYYAYDWFEDRDLLK